jgi:hypothetical protein
MNLLCLRDFNEGDISAKAGDVIGVPEIVANRLLDAWPGAWQRIMLPHGELSLGSVNVAADMGDVEKAIEAPPVDKMVHKAKAKRRG